MLLKLFRVSFGVIMLHGTLTAATAPCIDGPSAECCCKSLSTVQILGSAAMHATAAYFAWQARSETTDIAAQKALLAAVVTNSVSAAGTSIAACVAPFSGEAASMCLSITVSCNFTIANAPIWSALGIEDNGGGVTHSLVIASCLSHLASVPSITAICSSLGGVCARNSQLSSL